MKKNLNLDVLRAVSCLLVVAIHVSNIYNRAYPDLSAASYGTALAVNAAACVSVPIFFMISGALLAGREPEIGKSLRRVGKYAGVTAFWFVFYLLWTTVYLGKTYDFRDVLATPPSTHLWFLYAILPIYLALPIIQALTQRVAASPVLTGWLAGLLLLSVAGEYVLSFTPLKTKYGIPLASGGRYFAFFFLGYVLFQNRDRIRLRPRTLWALFAGASLACALLTGIATRLEGVHNEHFFEYRNPLIFVSSAAVFLLASRAPLARLGAGGTRLINHIAANSLGIYLFHAVFLNLLNRELTMTVLPAALGIPLYTLAIFLATDACVTGLRRVKGVRYFFS